LPGTLARFKSSYYGYSARRSAYSDPVMLNSVAEVIQSVLVTFEEHRAGHAGAAPILSPKGLQKSLEVSAAEQIRAEQTSHCASST
jgi:hypothetical protein